jgi:hypothetical protein
MTMRTTLAILALVAVAGLAGADTGASFASANNLCEPLLAAGVQPPTLCPNVSQSGAATLVGCDGAGRCDVSIHDLAQAQGALVALGDLNATAQIEDGSEPAVPICDAPGASAATCEGTATLSLPVPLAGCTRFRVSADEEVVVTDPVHVLDVETSYALWACGDGSGGATLAYAG